MNDKLLTSEKISVKEILKFLAGGGVIVASFVAPNILRSFSFLLKDKNSVSWKKFNQFRLRQDINRLYKQGLIKKKKRHNQMVFSLTKKGEKETLKKDLRDIALKKEKTWDKKWRVIIFDIPEQKKKARDALRQMFKFLGIYQLQKSVFIYPYDCEKEVDLITHFYNVSDYIFYLKAEIVEIEYELKRIFNIH